MEVRHPVRPLTSLHFRLVSSLIFGSLLKGLSKIVFRSNCCEVDLNYSCGQNYNQFALLLEIPQEIRFEEDRRGRRSGATLIEWVWCQPLATLPLTLFIWKKTATI